MTDEDYWPDEPPPEPDEPGPSLSLAGRDIDQSRDKTTVHGDQIIVYLPASEIRKGVRKLHATAVTLTQQLAGFVEPPGLSRLVALLARERALVLICPAGVVRCGQRSAAAFLVDRLNAARGAGAELDFQQALLDDDADLADGLSDVDQAALFFDAAGASGSERLRQFTALDAKLDDGDSVAVLAVSDEHAGEAERWFPGRTHRLARPDGAEVFRRHCADLPAALTDGLLADHWMADRLTTGWPPEVSHLARLARTAHENGTATVGELVALLRGSLDNWTEEARSDLRSQLTAPRRALLLSAALLEGSGPAVLVEARDLLLRISSYDGEPVHPLERPDVLAEVADLTSTTLDPQTTRFARPGYGPALLHLAWRDHPSLHPLLRAWLDRLPGLAGNAENVAGLAARVAGLAVSARADRLPIDVARRWVRGGGERRQLAAVLLLREAALHPVLGYPTRRWMYAVAYHRGAGTALRVVLAEVAGAFDVPHQSAAMTRLKHLAAATEPEVSAAVRQAVLHLSAEMNTGQLLRYLTDWLAAADPQRAETVVWVACRVLDGAAPPGRAAAVPFWRTALDVLPADQAGALIHGWLRLHGGSAAPVGILLDAAGSDLRRLGQLLWAARTPDDEQQPIVALFQQVRLRLDELTGGTP